MGATGSVGRPTTSEGYVIAAAYAADPDAEKVPNWLSQEIDNTAKAYFLSQIRDLYDTIAVQATTVPGVLLFPQYINVDTVVTANYDAVTFSRGIEVGTTVEVAPGSILTWGSQDAINVDQIQVTTNITVEDYTGNYVALLSDASKAKRNTGAASSFTIDTVANVGWSVGDTITVINEGSGDVTLTAAVGVTFVGNTTLPSGGAVATLVMTEDDNFVITGATT